MIVSKVSAHSLELEWRPPLGDGGSTVLGYVVEMTESGSGGRWVKVGYVSNRETRFTVAGLAEGASYFFRVFAENRAGLSRPLQSDCVTPSQPLGTSNSTFVPPARAQLVPGVLFSRYHSPLPSRIDVISAMTIVRTIR